MWIKKNSKDIRWLAKLNPDKASRRNKSSTTNFMRTIGIP